MAIRKITAVAMIALLALLTACSSIDRGTITTKDHQAGYYYPVTYCASYKSNGQCSFYAVRQDYMPPNWKFNLRLEDETGWVYVSEDTYNRYEVGDFYG